MNIDDNDEMGFPDEEKGASAKDGVLDGVQRSIQLVDLKVNVINEDAKGLAIDEFQGPGVGEVQQQQPQGTVVCWERFLHLRSIRVLLVENDHSTRHVVSALLRNCNYEVLEAANGLQAWKILEDLTNHIDLVLTEVVMPCLSGIALLCKIMSHRTRKNIPVIMMSSNDSMGLVVTCLSKGAVDFLVKPVRKNELKNLWQHVWRRCHSSSGSGSESGTQTLKYVKSKGSENPDNSESVDGENDGSNGLTVGDGSDDGSGAQSSWTKQAIEADSFQAMSPIDRVAECQDSTCAQVIISNEETSGIKKVHMCVSGEGCEHILPGTAAEGKDLLSTIFKNQESQSENPFEIQPVPVGKKFKSLPESNCNTNIELVEEGHSKLTSESLIGKCKCGNDKFSRTLIDVSELESSREVNNMLNISDKTANDLGEPNLELSLKRLREVQDTERSVQNDRYILRRSELSAFSRYNTSSNFHKTDDGITGRSSVIDCSVDVAKRESVGDIQALSTDIAVYHNSNGVCNNIDMGSTTNKLSSHTTTKKDKSEATSTVNCLSSSAFKHVKNELRFTQQEDCLLLQKDMCNSDVVPIRDLHEETRILHPHYPENNHHFHRLKEHPSFSTFKKLVADDPHFESTDALLGCVDNNHSNSSLNRSASGSKHGSNGLNGSNTVINPQVIHAESDVGQAGKSGSGDATGSGCGNRVDENKLSQREATLNKFRQKRKERCFTKKVRYQNRKKLAEQRPRVRGQFVKQAGANRSNKGEDE